MYVHTFEVASFLSELAGCFLIVQAPPTASQATNIAMSIATLVGDSKPDAMAVLIVIGNCAAAIQPAAESSAQLQQHRF